VVTFHLEATGWGSVIVIDNKGHDVTSSLDGPELECQAGSEGVRGRDHSGARKSSGPGEVIHVQADEVWNEKEEPSAGGQEAVGGQAEHARIRNRLNGGSWTGPSFLIESAWESGKSLVLEDLSDSGGTQIKALVFECLTDLVNRVVLLP
jgi:hypothetical protein